MIRINLIPTKSSHQRELAIFQIVVGVVLIGVAFGVSYLVNQGVEKKIDQERIVIADLKRQIDDLQNVIKEVESFKKKKKDLELKIQTIRDLNDKRSGPVRLLEEIGDVLPSKLYITTFKETEKNLMLEGQSSDGTAISDLVDNLKKSKYFQNVQLMTISSAGEAGKKIQRFTIQCVVNYIVRNA